MLRDSKCLNVSNEALEIILRENLDAPASLSDLVRFGCLTRVKFGRIVASEAISDNQVSRSFRNIFLWAATDHGDSIPGVLPANGERTREHDHLPIQRVFRVGVGICRNGDQPLTTTATTATDSNNLTSTPGFRGDRSKSGSRGFYDFVHCPATQTTSQRQEDLRTDS